MSEPPAVRAPVLLEHRESHAHVILNRPEKLNAIDGEMLEQLAQALATVEAAPGIRALVLRGAGRAFCAGADLDDLSPKLSDAATYATFLDRWHAVLGALAGCSVPTIAAVHGFALAGGFELVEACDLAVMADDAQLGDQHARFGLFPAGGSTQRLPRLLGRRRALWMLLSGARLSADEALLVGLVNDVAPAELLIDRASEMAELLASRSASNNAAIKRAVDLGAGVALDEAFAAERQIVLEQMFSPDARAGLAAFATNTTPQFEPMGLDER